VHCEDFQISTPSHKFASGVLKKMRKHTMYKIANAFQDGIEDFDTPLQVSLQHKLPSRHLTHPVSSVEDVYVTTDKFYIKLALMKVLPRNNYKNPYRLLPRPSNIKL